MAPYRRLEQDYCGAALRPDSRCTPDPFFMLGLETLEEFSGIILRPRIDQTMALTAKQHEIKDVVDVLRPPSLLASWALLLEGDDVCLLSERRRLPSQAMDRHILVAALELAPPSRYRIQPVGDA